MPTLTTPDETTADSATAYVLHYTSADGPGDDATWSVYREQYVTADADEPIDGTSEHVSTHPTEAEARAEARRLQEATGRADHPPTWGACGVEGCVDCRPLYDADNNPIPGT